jgi:hypothetical protein
MKRSFREKAKARVEYYTKPNRVFLIALLLLVGVFAAKTISQKRDAPDTSLIDEASVAPVAVKAVRERPSADADKDCTDNSQCHFACMAEISYPEAGRDKNYVYHGHCAASGTGLCRMQVKDGKLFDNPSQLCVN